MKSIFIFLFLVTIFIINLSSELIAQQKPNLSPTPSVEVRKPPETGSFFRDSLTKMEFIFVKGGCFEMGDTFGDGYSDENPVHEVCVDGFYIGKYEVTQGQWERVMGQNPSRFKSGDHYPVENVNWNDVQDFIQRLNQRTGNGYRLPTIAEWEYASRSGGKREKWAGTNNESELGEFAWYLRNSGNRTFPVGQKRPNGLGLYDMTGNVWEWCQDVDDKESYKKSLGNNGGGPVNGNLRGLRGGSWGNSPQDLRSSNRFRLKPMIRNYVLGFRVVLPAHQIAFLKEGRD